MTYKEALQMLRPHAEAYRKLYQVLELLVSSEQELKKIDRDRDAKMAEAQESQKKLDEVLGSIEVARNKHEELLKDLPAKYAEAEKKARANLGAKLLQMEKQAVALEDKQAGLSRSIAVKEKDFAAAKLELSRVESRLSDVRESVKRSQQEVARLNV